VARSHTTPRDVTISGFPVCLSAAEVVGSIPTTPTLSLGTSRPTVPATYAISGESSGHYGFGFGWGSWALVAAAIASSSSARWRWESLKCWLVGSILSSISPRASAA
jgi:hypothetical protein